MNIIKNLIQKIEERRKETKDPCKNYATYEAAENAAKKAAKEGAEHFGVNDINYLVFYNPWWERYCIALHCIRFDCDFGKKPCMWLPPFFCTKRLLLLLTYSRFIRAHSEKFKR
jgi:hypothetical protein